MSPALFVLACAVGVVMLIVCANLSNLQLARYEHAAKGNGDAGGVRSRARFRLLRQMLTESVALSCCGAVLGLLLAVAGTRELAHLACIQPSFARKRSDRRKRAPFHVAGSGRYRRALWPAAGITGPGVLGRRSAARTAAAARAAANGMPGSATDWWFPRSPSPASCWSARDC